MNAMQHAQRDQPCVAIINTSEETIQLLQELMMDEGFATVIAYVPEFKRGVRDIDAFFHEHQPQAVLYDIAIPYIENWTFFKDQVLARNLLPATCFVITTTNRTVLDLLVGPTNAIELIGRPFDLDTIVQAVNRALASSRTT
jgi:DNA-binding NtrC family response regulator